MMRRRFLSPAPIGGLLLLLVCLCGSTRSLADESEDPRYRNAVAAMRNGQFEQAIAGFEQVLVDLPRSTRSLLNIGLCHSRRGDAAAAIQAYERLLAIAPDHARANNNLANVYFRQGKYELASERYQKALAQEPDYLRALYHYGWVERQLNRSEPAHRAFSRCLELPAENDRDRATQLDCRFYLATLEFRNGEYERARMLLERLLERRPGHVEARHYLGRTYQKLGRREAAREQLEIHRQLLRSARSDQPIRKQQQP